MNRDNRIFVFCLAHTLHAFSADIYIYERTFQEMDMKIGILTQNLASSQVCTASSWLGLGLGVRGLGFGVWGLGLGVRG